MPLIEDHHYLKICAQLASSLSISISAARRKVEVAAAKEGKKDLQSRKDIAQKILKQTLNEDKEQSVSASASLEQVFWYTPMHCLLFLQISLVFSNVSLSSPGKQLMFSTFSNTYAKMKKAMKSIVFL